MKLIFFFQNKTPLMDDTLILPEKKKKVSKIPDAKERSSFTYVDLLERAYKNLALQREEKDTLSKTKLSFPLFDIQKLGGKRTRWNNFKVVCQIMKRDPIHVQKFIEMELGEPTYLPDALLIKAPGNYSRSKFVSLISRYVEDYVKCKSCNSYNSLLTKNQVLRLMELDCQQCHAVRNCAAFQSAFKATTRSDRKKDKAALI